MTTLDVPARVATIDCDVHCAAPDAVQLVPFLDEVWEEFVGISGFRRPSAVEVTTHPSWLGMTATTPQAVTLEAVRRDVMSLCEAAILNCYFGVDAVTHPDLGPALARALNDWMAANWLDAEPRLRGSAVVAPQHVEQAAAEVARIGEDRRFVQICVPAHARVAYGDRQYWPIWNAAAEAGLVVGITAGGAVGAPPTPVNWLGSFFEEYAAAMIAFESHVTSLIMSGVFERIPDLRIAVLDSGWGWLPPLCWRMDQQWRNFHREIPWLTGPPSSYISRFFRFGLQPFDVPGRPEQIRQLLERIDGGGILLYGSDYPHAHQASPTEILSLLDADDAARVASANAREWYRLPPPTDITWTA
jgi:uncharacterized protein